MCRIRAILILCVALAYMGAPLALDACARACASAGPACHPALPASAHVGHVPALCGNEHDAVSSSPQDPRSFRIVAGVGTAVMATQPDSLRHLLVRERPCVASPPLIAGRSASSSPLRL